MKWFFFLSTRIILWITWDKDNTVVIVDENEWKRLIRERASTYGRKKSLWGFTRRTPSTTKEISKKKSAEGRIGLPLPIRQRQPSMELRTHSKHQSLRTGNPYWITQTLKCPALLVTNFRTLPSVSQQSAQQIKKVHEFRAETSCDMAALSWIFWTVYFHFSSLHKHKTITG